MGIEDRHLLLEGIAIAIVLAVAFDIAVSRYRMRAAGLISAATLAGALLVGTIGWWGEAPGLHFTNPQLSRQLDWLGHVGMPVAQYVFPVLLGLVVTLALSRTRLPCLVRMTVTGGAVFAGLFLGVMLMFFVMLAVYHDGP